MQTTTILTLLLFTFVSCTGVNQVQKIEPEAGAGPPQGVRNYTAGDVNSVTPYRLVPGDVLDIKFFYTPELNETATIRPDGKITLQLVGDVQAAGLTPSELDDFLTDQYAGELRQVEIAVIVKTFSAHKVYIGGEVEDPGVIQLTERMSTLQAIFNAGGFKNTAETRNVIIIRKGNGETPVVYLTLDLQGVISAQDEDVFLHPYDVVFVPRSAIAEVNLFVSQYIDQVIPTSLTQLFLGFLYLEAIRDNE